MVAGQSHEISEGTNDPARAYLCSGSQATTKIMTTARLCTAVIRRLQERIDEFTANGTARTVAILGQPPGDLNRDHANEQVVEESPNTTHM